MVNLSRSIYFLIPVIIGILAFVWLKGDQQPPVIKENQQLAKKVRVQTVEPTDFIPVAQGFGEVRPEQVWKAIAQVSGRVDYLHPRLKDGELIEQDEILIRIDPIDYQLSLAEAQVQLAQLEIERSNAAALLEIEERNLSLAEKEYNRIKELVSQGSVSRSNADSAERTLLSSRSAVQNLKNTLALFPTNQKQLQVKIAQAQRDLDNTQITAPFNMRVSGMTIETNQFVGRGEHMFSGDSIQRIEITAQIAMSSIRNLFIKNGFQLPSDLSEINRNIVQQLGFSPTVSLDIGADRPATWKARFLRSSDSVDSETRTLGIVVAVDEPLKKIVPGIRPPLSKGMLVEVSIAGKAQVGSIVIPRNTVRDGRVYLVDENNRLSIQPVKLLYEQQQHAIISEGIVAGDRLVLSDLVPAVAGMLLDPVIE